MSGINPAYHIPLGADKLQLVGEICAIQGQIEWMMLHSVKRMLKVDEALARRIMGSVSIATNAEIWIGCIRKTVKQKGALSQAERAFSDIAKLTEGRNDFVHAIYFAKTTTNPTGLLVRIATANSISRYDDAEEAVAVRVRTGKEASIERLQQIRDKAAEISVRVAHATWFTHPTARKLGRSPWLGRLDELPPLNPPKAEPRRAKERPSRPRSSQQR